MEKLYGFKENDIELLADEIKNKGNKSLTSVFEEFSLKTGKAKGTVRNMYYSLAKKTNEDINFCKKYFDKPLLVGKAESFKEEEEKELIKKIVQAKNSGRSVRNAILEYSNGDMKLALRYQNKYRNVIKNNPQLLSEVMSEFSGQNLAKTVEAVSVSEVQFRRLKREIDGLVDRISAKYKKENVFLKKKIAFLEAENFRLNNILFGETNLSGAAKYFSNKDGKNMLN